MMETRLVEVRQRHSEQQMLRKVAGAWRGLSAAAGPSRVAELLHTVNTVQGQCAEQSSRLTQ